MRRALAVFVTALVIPVAASADTAFVTMADNFCNDPAASMDFEWAKHVYKGQGELVLFYVEKDQFKPIGHTRAFGEFAHVVVSSHGDAGLIGNERAKDFAATFADQHQTAPDTVTFMVCKSADGVPSVGMPSVLRALALKYPATVGGGTAIDTLRGAKGYCALTKPQGKHVTKIDQALYRQGVVQTVTAKYITDQIMNKWENDNIDYNGKEYTLQNFCKDFASGQDMMGEFMSAVANHFEILYLELVNARDDGQDLFTCGASHVNKGCD